MTTKSLYYRHGGTYNFKWLHVRHCLDTAGPAAVALWGAEVRANELREQGYACIFADEAPTVFAPDGILPPRRKLYSGTTISVTVENDESVTSKTKWADFARDNADDPDLLADIVRQVADRGYARIGGGAAPIFRISPL